MNSPHPYNKLTKTWVAFAIQKWREPRLRTKDRSMQPGEGTQDEVAVAIGDNSRHMEREQGPV